MTRVVLCFALLPVLGVANPSGEQVVAGQVEFERAGSTLSVNQGTDRAIINWQDFSIGEGNTTRFFQPSNTSAVLNRVVGNNLSAIHGNLQANGQVYLINPNGVLIGASGVIQTGGFIASTHDVANSEFLAGGDLTFTPGAAASGAQVVNLGAIDVDGGDVFLIAETVRNEGTIRAADGTVGLAAAGGAEVLLSPGGEEKILVRPASADAETGGGVVNSGTIDAVQAELKAVGGNTYALAIENSGVVRATGAVKSNGRVMLSAGGEGSIANSGSLKASKADGSGGKIKIAAGGAVANDGTMDASGSSGGGIAISASRGSHTGTIEASGLEGNGGDISITVAEAYHDTLKAKLNAAGVENGGSIRVEATAADSRIYSSSTMDASGVAGVGGDIVVTADELYLMGSNLRADGANGGGTIRAGGGFQGADAEVANASSLYVNQSATLTANATDTGDGGTLVLWADGTTDFFGRIEAQGGSFGGNGGFMEVSGKDSLRFGGFATAAAPAGGGGTLLLDPKNITVDTFNSEGSPILFEFIDPNKAAGNVFGDSVAPLSSGNVVITSTYDDFNAADSGAVYLFDGSNGDLISTLRGSTAGDQVGRDGITTLSNGNFLINSSLWKGNRGAVTWGDGNTGVMGVVSAANSLVGTDVNDYVGAGGITSLGNGNYVVNSPFWSGNRGAVTWGNGSTGIIGEVSVGNSLVGSNANDRVGFASGFTGITALSNGNYVVNSNEWNDNRGAATWGNGSTGITGEVTGTNSLVGSNVGDRVGSTRVVSLANGNYVVVSNRWNGNRGAVTWGNGITGIMGEVSVANSLVGTNAGDFVGNFSAQPLANGHYVVVSNRWNGDRGAVTWGNGSTGIIGEVSVGNSLVGTNANDRVGNFGIGELTNGNYVVNSPFWNGRRGAVTWGDGAMGVVGQISAANSLVGSNANDEVGLQRVTLLANGNYVVNSSGWNGSRGAVTWGDGTSGIVGFVSAANSLVGTNANDRVGNFGVWELINGNYVVKSAFWNSSRGAVTWADGSTGIFGQVSAVNSLVGTDVGDQVGNGSITLLANGNYAISSSDWNGNRGAVTWGSGTAGIIGEVSAANSLVGTNVGDRVGNGGATPLANGNYVVRSIQWGDSRGAATWGDGAAGIIGEVSAANSLVGTTVGDRVGIGSITPLTNGNYVVRSNHWNGNRGAVTWGNGNSGIIGEVSSANSLVGTMTVDSVGTGEIILLSNGNYVVLSSQWGGTRGAVTWGNGSVGSSGEISAANSILGGNPAAPFPPFTFSLDPVNETFLSGFYMDISGGAGGRVYASSIHGPGPVSGLLFGDSPGKNVTITALRITDITNTGTSIILQANNDITVNAPITTSHSAGNGGAIRMQAGRSILLNANITTGNGDLTLVANETLANGVIDAHRDAGEAEITMAAGSSINAGTGMVSITLADGAGKTHSGAGAINLRDISASSILVENLGTGGGADVVLNGILIGTGTGDAITLAGGQFHNHTGAAALDAPDGRWLIFANDVDGNTFGGLNSGNQALWNADYGSNIAPAGNRYVFANQPTLTFTTTDATKSFGDDLTGSVGSQFMVSGWLDASAYGNVFTQDTLANTTTGTAVASSVGADSAASVDGSPYEVAVDISEVFPTTGYALAKVETGEITVTSDSGPIDPGPVDPVPIPPLPTLPLPVPPLPAEPLPIEPLPIELPLVQGFLDNAEMLGSPVRRLGDGGYPIFRFLLREEEGLRLDLLEVEEEGEKGWLVRLRGLMLGRLD